MITEPRLRSLAQLEEESGVPARTVRYYISRGLLPGPLHGGRGAAYGDEHATRLRMIQDLQTQGLTLAEIALHLSGGREVPLPEPAPVWKYQMASDVTVEVRGDVSPWRMKQIRSALADLAERLGTKEEEQ